MLNQGPESFPHKRATELAVVATSAVSFAEFTKLEADLKGGIGQRLTALADVF